MKHKNNITQSSYRPTELPPVEVPTMLTVNELRDILNEYELEGNHIVCFNFKGTTIPISKAYMNIDGDLFILEP